MSWPGRHLIDVDELSGADVARVMSLAETFERVNKVEILRTKHVALIFAEPSTRTRLSFEMAARRLGGHTYMLEPLSSSMVKGETLVDTARNLDALGFRFLIVRHHRAGAAAVAARHFGGSVINAGDGWHAHPTQALLDLFTLRRHFASEDLSGRKIAIVGDVMHSRVAKSNVWTLTGAGAEVFLCGPREWLRGLDALPATLTDDLNSALRDADAVMGLRVQKERMARGVSLDAYIDRYQVTEARFERLAPLAPYLHPGPINEGVEVTHEVARGPRSLVLDQARNGVPVRMAVLAILAGEGDQADPARTEDELVRSSR